MRRAALVLVAATVALVVATGVAWAATIACREGARVCGGTNRADRINGTPAEDNAYARRGPDVVTTLAGGDLVQGGAGTDRAYGGNDGDIAYGGESGSPDLSGVGPFTDRNDDIAHGGPGDDRLIGGFGRGGRDGVFGGAGDDFVQTAQRGSINELDVKLTEEVVDCGPGEDTVRFDQGIDAVSRETCENLNPVPPGGGMGAEGQSEALFR